MNSIFKLSSWYPQFIKDIKNPFFQISLLIVILVNVILKIRAENDEKVHDGIKEANLGLLIAYLAHLDLVFAAFWAIILFSRPFLLNYLLPF